MSCRKALIIILIVFPVYAFTPVMAQEVNDVAKITFFDPGVSFEKAIGKNKTIYGQAFFATSFAVGFSSALGTRTSFKLEPAVALQYRHYYNFAKRQAKYKRTDMNSLNYICPAFQAIFSKDRISTAHHMETRNRPINNLGVLWGFQRNYKSRFSLDVNMGPSFLFTRSTVPDNYGITNKQWVGKMTATGQVTIGLWINKRA